MKPNSIILLSGGLDSAVNFQVAYEQTDIMYILHFDYGQRARARELEAVRAISKKAKVPLEVISLDFIKHLDSGLTTGIIPDFDSSKLDSVEYSRVSAKSVWVPNRNAVLISIAAAYADKFHIQKIITGFNREEGATFPDNTPEFLESMNASLKYSTLFHPKVESYTISMTKSEIVALGKQNGAPLEFVYSCYHGESRMCGHCESCQRLIRALEKNDYLPAFNKINQWGFQ